MASTRTPGVMSAGSAALRKVMAGSFSLRDRSANGSESAHRAHHATADDSISAVIEGEIIPRLLMAHASGSGIGDQSRSQGHISSADARKFADLPLKLEAANLIEEVDTFLAAGVTVETIYLDLLAPAARKLGEMWEEDECDFVDVTMGLWRLQEVMREISDRAPRDGPATGADSRTALFASVPGDQHYFGAIMIEEVFARAGWDSEVLTLPERSELLDRLAQKPFAVVGLTLSRDCPSAALTSLIKAMRSVSANPNISVLIGGRAVNEDPSIVTTVGADGTGADARAALEEAEKLARSQPVRAHSMR